jgi:Protein of unknown function (DUF3238)
MFWTDPKKDIQTGRIIQFEGDSREFTPYVGNTLRSRVEQEVVVDRSIEWRNGVYVSQTIRGKARALKCLGFCLCLT